MPSPRACLVASMMLVALPFAPGALAQPAADPWTACERAITAAERGSGLPPGLLRAIAQVESGRARPGGGTASWPFALNAAGQSLFPDNRQAAIETVLGLRAQGVASIDVGCMQINLVHHPEAFPTLEAAFDSPRNVAYAVRFLRELYGRTGNWGEAIGQYHSGDPGRATAYQARVMAARLSLGGIAMPRVTRGLCAGSRQAIVQVGPNRRPRVVCRA